MIGAVDVIKRPTLCAVSARRLHRIEVDGGNATGIWRAAVAVANDGGSRCRGAIHAYGDAEGSTSPGVIDVDLDLAAAHGARDGTFGRNGLLAVDESKALLQDLLASAGPFALVGDARAVHLREGIGKFCVRAERTDSRHGANGAPYAWVLDFAPLTDDIIASTATARCSAGLAAASTTGRRATTGCATCTKAAPTRRESAPCSKPGTSHAKTTSAGAHGGRTPAPFVLTGYAATTERGQGHGGKESERGKREGSTKAHQCTFPTRCELIAVFAVFRLHFSPSNSAMPRESRGKQENSSGNGATSVRSVTL